MFFILLHHYVDIVGSKFNFLYFFETGLRMLFECGRIQLGILNEISENYMYFILLHHYADIAGSKFDFLYSFETGLRMLFEGG